MDTKRLLELLDDCTSLPWAKSSLAPLYIIRQDYADVICSLGEYNADGTIDGVFDKAEQHRDLIVAAVNALPELLAERDKLREALRQISEGRGRFSLDQQEFANNTIEDMKAIAVAALHDSAAGMHAKENGHE